MLELDISEKCKEEWKRTLNVDIFAQPDDELIDLMSKIINHSASQEDIRKTVMKLASNFKVKINKVSFVSDNASDALGGFSEDNCIIFNLNNDNASESKGVSLLITIVHELRHAQQKQYFSHLDSEFGRTIKDSFSRYTAPIGSLRNRSLYQNNFLEVDAETFAHVYTQHLLDQIKDKKGLPQHVQAELDMRASESQKEIKATRELLSLNRTGIQNIRDSFVKYVNEILPSTTLTKEQKNELAHQLIEIANPVVYGNEKGLFGIESGHLNYIKEKMFEGCDPFVILDNLDNDFIKYIEELEVHFRDMGLYGYGKYTMHLKSIVSRCEELLGLKDIKFNKDNPSEIVKKAFDVIPQLILDNMGKPENDTTSKLENILTSISVHLPQYYKKLINFTKEFIEDSIPREQLIEYMEREAGPNYKKCYCGPSSISHILLAGYYNDYRVEKTFHSKERFLQFRNAKYNINNFYEFRETFNKELAKFLVQCLLKSSFNEEEKDYLKSYELGVYNLDPSFIEKEIKDMQNNIFARNKLNKLNKLLQENNHPLFKIFDKRGIHLSEFLKNSKSK